MTPRLWSRRLQRWTHLLLAGALGTYLYSPLSGTGVAELAVQLVVFPALVVSGVLMWKGGGIRARLRTRRRDDRD